MIRIQLALDRLTLEQCIYITNEVSPFVDNIEIGTGVIKEYGMESVRLIRKRFLDKVIVADMKTCDAGRFEAIQAFESGADITTVMGYAEDSTIKEMLSVAKDYKCKLMVDLLGITEVKRIQELYNLGVRMFNIHIGIDLQKEKEWSAEDFLLLEDFEDIEVVVSGGITKEVVPLLLKQSPHVLIVGSSITSNQDPKRVARELKLEVTKYERNN